MNNTIKLLDTREVSKILKCSLPTARAFMNQEDFPLIMVGKSYKVLDTSFYEYLSRGGLTYEK